MKIKKEIEKNKNKKHKINRVFEHCESENPKYYDYSINKKNDHKNNTKKGKKNIKIENKLKKNEERVSSSSLLDNEEKEKEKNNNKKTK